MHLPLAPRPTILAVGMFALTAVLIGAGPASAAAPTTADPAAAAAGWLATQLVDGTHIETTFDLDGNGTITDDERFPDYGLTADTVIALAAAGVGGRSIDAATGYLRANVDAYAGSGTESYAGPLAKLLLVADITGSDPTDFGGVDLLTRLLATETPTGRFSDISAFGDYSSSLTQSLAVLALQRTAPARVDPTSVAVLVAQQCADGGPNDGAVAFTIGADPCADVDIDTTAFAVQALSATTTTAPARAGLAFLTGAQASDGGFSDDGTENSNSTGLAAQALAAGGRTAPATAARAWLVDRQVGCAAPAEQQGAIAFTDDAGVPLYDDRATRASAQAVPGLAGIGFTDISATGAAPAAPRLDCSVVTTSPTPTDTTSASASSSGSSSSSPSSSAPGSTTTTTSSSAGPPTTRGSTTALPVVADGGTLAYTGSPVAALTAGGLLTVAAGAGLIVASRRRRGAHE